MRPPSLRRPFGPHPPIRMPFASAKSSAARSTPVCPPETILLSIDWPEFGLIQKLRLFDEPLLDEVELAGFQAYAHPPGPVSKRLGMNGRRRAPGSIEIGGSSTLRYRSIMRSCAGRASTQSFTARSSRSYASPHFRLCSMSRAASPIHFSRQSCAARVFRIAFGNRHKSRHWSRRLDALGGSSPCRIAGSDVFALGQIRTVVRIGRRRGTGSADREDDSGYDATPCHRSYSNSSHALSVRSRGASSTRDSRSRISVGRTAGSWRGHGGIAPLFGSPLRANAHHVSITASERRSASGPLPEKSAIPGAASVPNTNGNSTAWHAPSAPCCAGEGHANS